VREERISSKLLKGSILGAITAKGSTLKWAAKRIDFGCVLLLKAVREERISSELLKELILSAIYC
jgi:hypothetical protein